MHSVHGHNHVVMHAAIDALPFDSRKRIARVSTYRPRVPFTPKQDLENSCPAVELGNRQNREET